MVAALMIRQIRTSERSRLTVLAPKTFFLEVPHGLDDRGQEEMDLVRNFGQLLHGVEDKGRRGVHDGSVLSRDDGAVPEFLYQ